MLQPNTTLRNVRCNPRVASKRSTDGYLFIQGGFAADVDTHAEGGEGGEAGRQAFRDGAGAGLMSDDQRAGLKKVGSVACILPVRCRLLLNDGDASAGVRCRYNSC